MEISDLLTPFFPEGSDYSKLLSCINFLLRNYRDYLAIIQGYHPFEWDEWIFTIAKVS